MVKRQFKDLAHLERYLKSSHVVNSIFRDKRVVEALRVEMSKAVHKVVYARYTPSRYTRRKDDGGLSDKRNMHITKVEVRGSNIVILFENLTVGQTRFIPIYSHNIDSMHGQFITDTIVESKPEDWYSPNATDDEGRVVSASRDFVSETIKNIKANPKPLIEAIKSAYRAIGLEVK